jgi:hypothetical protein
MAATPGFEGYVKIGTNSIAQIKSNTFDLDRAMEDITSMSTTGTPSPFKSFLPTLAEASFSITCNWDLTDTNGQLAMQNAWLNGTLLTFILSPNNGTNTYAFSAYIKKIQIKTDVAKVVESQIDLQPTGTISFT